MLEMMGVVVVRVVMGMLIVVWVEVGAVCDLVGGLIGVEVGVGLWFYE